MKTVTFGRADYSTSLNQQARMSNNLHDPINPLVQPFEELMLDNQYKLQKEVEKFFIANEQRSKMSAKKAKKARVAGNLQTLTPDDLSKLAVATGLTAGQSGLRLLLANGGPEARKINLLA
jgi:hypothetical protein